jgi:lipopolysaccharide export system protein LptC
MTAGHHVNWLPLGGVALLALLSAWLNQLAMAPQVIDNGGFAHDPDFIAEQFSAQSFDQQGRPQHRLSATRMAHYMDDDTMELQAPRFQLEGDHSVMRVEARRGLIFGEGEAVHFLGDVVATRQVGPGQPLFSLKTEHLRVVPDSGIMTSEKPVELRQGNSEIHAGGLFIDNQNKLLRLTGGVRGLYEKTR